MDTQTKREREKAARFPNDRPVLQETSRREKTLPPMRRPGSVCPAAQ